MSLDQTFGLKSIKRLIALVDKESKRYGVIKYKIYFDMARLYLRHGVGPNYYLLAGLANPDATKVEKDGHLSTRQYKTAINKLNPPLYRKITQNKLSEKAFLGLIGAPISEFYGYFNRQSGFISNSSGPLKNAHQLNDLFKKHKDEILCFKLLEGWGGKGFIAGKVKIQDGTPVINRLYSNICYTSEEIISHFQKYDANGAFLLESYIEQHLSYSRFNETSLNTIRVWTLILRNGISKTICAYLRVGRQGSLTDNGDGGGIMCPVDIKSGIVGPGLLTATPFREEFLVHPDTGLELAGQQLDGWRSITELCEVTLPMLPHTRFAGFDIAMSTDGPMIVEINVCPDKDGAAFGRCMSRELKDHI